MTPLKALQQWFAKVPPEIQGELACFAVTYGGEQLFLPIEDQGRGTPSEMLAQFQEMLMREPSSPMVEVGKVIVVAALLDFTFLKRSTKEDWARTAKFIQGGADYAKETGKDAMLQSTEKFAAQVPLRAGMWIREAQVWGELRSGPLSLRQLHDWMMRVL